MSIGALAAIFATSFGVSLSGAISPGPLTTLAIREGVRRGFWAGPSLALGHGVIELVLVVALALGLNQLLDRDAVTASIALVGGGVLLWLGVRTLLALPGQELRIQDLTERADEGAPRKAAVVGPAAASLMVAGVVISVSNPFWVAWWATIGSAYIVESLEQGAAGVASFYGAHVLTDFLWLGLIAFALATGRRLMTDRTYRLILGACGVFLLALGGWFLSSGLGYVL